MKKTFYFLTAILIISGLGACKKDKKENIKPQPVLEQADISARWLVSNAADFESFEFNEDGNYIVVEGTELLFGTYYIRNNTTLVLSELGTITLSEIDEDHFNFTLILDSDPDNEIPIETSKQQEMEHSTNTELLCRSWELISINGINIQGTDYESTVIFSQAGTYFIKWADGEMGMARWKWQSGAETSLLYSWEEIPDWEEADMVQILELSQSELHISEQFGSEVETYVLHPLSTNSSKETTAGNSIHRKSKTGGMLVK